MRVQKCIHKMAIALGHKKNMYRRKKGIKLILNVFVGVFMSINTDMERFLLSCCRCKIKMRKLLC